MENKEYLGKIFRTEKKHLMIDENGLTNKIDDLCNGSRSFTENLLRNYYQFLEKDPHYLEDMLKQYSFG